MITDNSKEKNYSSFLVASDIDGTLNNRLRKTPKVNTMAIDRFVHELKGNFTLASARSVESLRPHYMNLPKVETPAIVLNGAGIYDFKKEEMVWFNAIEEEAVEIIAKSLDRFKELEVGVFCDDMIYLVRPVIFSRAMMMADNLAHKSVSSIYDVPFKNWGKVIFFVYPWKKNEIMSFVRELAGDRHKLIDTAICSFDLVNKTTDKGNAVFKLCELLGADEKNICAIGDYYNDLDMLKKVSHSACAGQAPEDIKKICEFKACHCNKGAVADFLKYIEETY